MIERPVSLEEAVAATMSKTSGRSKMKYKSLTIHEYRGIQEPVTFNLEKESIFPIIGVNECGKTTALQAILAFDFTCDSQNGGRHMKDTCNLYSVRDGDPRVSADIEISGKELRMCLSEARPTILPGDVKLAQYWLEKIGIKTDFPIEAFLSNVETILASARETSIDSVEKLKKVRRKFRAYRRAVHTEKKIDSSPDVLCTITIVRRLNKSSELKYSLQSVHGFKARIQNTLAKAIVRRLDFLLYFDDFRYDVPARISIDQKSENEWTSILKTLFSAADPEFCISQLPTLEARRRKSVMAKVEKFLNSRLTKQWETFHLEEKKSLTIRLNYHEDNNSPEISFEVVEQDEGEQEFFFSIKDRSKGFFWFFNFVMRLEFNAKRASGGNIIYLLDEPGSYLHARAQDQLCAKLTELAIASKVFYCTHSHHLLDPHVIPYNAIRIAEKSDEKRITLKLLSEHQTDFRRDAAFQPILEALQVRPAAIDIDRRRVIVTEGLYDFFSFDMFRPTDDFCILPAVSADSIRYHLSWLMAWGADYRALWDNDKEGIDKKTKAESIFGELEASKRFRLLPLAAEKSKRRLEDLYDPFDLDSITCECKLPANASFNRKVQTLYYHPLRSEIISNLAGTTKRTFAEVLLSIW